MSKKKTIRWAVKLQLTEVERMQVVKAAFAADVDVGKWVAEAVRRALPTRKEAGHFDKMNDSVVVLRSRKIGGDE